ncbi:General transcription factor 3C polypeptide 1 [Armadillidium nasatum]|uniref:General transcription factor 3C polypeptide 1 n=1 Tax=Armadillidium nasatum TaxID=96803 RepID=A0A5N5SYJ0_9CRUS|nr:General transcription factor 3C polypeptide 1 [Armadillidium nasatum]
MLTMNHSAVDYLTHVEDEIALEGLDGITIQGLWLRLSLRHNFTSYLQLDDNSKKFLWDLIIADEEIEFFALEEPRPELKIFNRYDYIDSELGLILEPQEDIPDIYPCLPVEDEENGIRGSCATYKTRENVTDDVVMLSLKEAVEIYGNQLVMVASQHLREKALAINAAIDKFYDLKLMQYIMLERIARSRTMGEITHGNNSLTVMKVPSKTMFYYRKRLLKLNLITKQSHRQRSVKGNISSSSLLHLTRFYVIRRSKFMMLIQKVVEKLKMKPNYVCPLLEIKAELGLQNVTNKKVLKCGDFQKHIQTTLVPYRQIYPNATIKEWKCKSRSDEKMIRCVKLINPSVIVDDIFAEEEEHEEGHIEGCEDDDDEDTEGFDSFPGILNQSNRINRRNLLQQAFFTIDSAGPNGMTQIDLSKKMGLSRLDSRTVCRALLKRNVIHSLMKDIGRQRVSKFVSNRYANTGHLLKEYQSEMKKMLDIVQNPSETVEEEAEEQNVKCPDTPSTSRVMEANVNSNVLTDVNVEVTSPNPKIVTENRILIKKESRTLAEMESYDSDSEEDCSESYSDKITSDSLEISKKLNASTFTASGKFSPRLLLKNKTSPHLTTRMMKRAIIIMNAIRNQKVIDDSYKLQKMIISAEEKEGLEAKMDKKSLMRLIERLSNSGYLKKFVVKFVAGSKTKNMNFFVDSNITLESKILKSSIEQHKNKFMLQASSSATSSPKKDQGASFLEDDHDENEPSTSGVKESGSSCLSKSGGKTKHPIKQEPSVGNSVLEMEEMNNIPHIQSAEAVSPDKAESSLNKASPADIPGVSIKGNVGPKFVRMQEFHKLLYYLETLTLDQTEAWININNLSKDEFSSENFDNYPALYLSEVSWKMFIPPLPKHPTLAVNGWIFIVDVLLRIPLTIFVQIVSVTCESRLLMEYLDHPIKRNLLVKNLPPDLRRYLLNRRRYVTYVMELCKRLCYVGLLQMGKQVMKEKDQVFVYLNRNASLIDTTISDPGYTTISPDKEYVSKEYVFKSLQDVIQFDMFTICMHTPLGAHGSVEGKKLTIKVLHKKPEMIESTKPRDYTEAPQRDNGFLPGDQNGAAGLDSSMFSHLRRNWSCSYSRFNTIPKNTSPNTDGEKSNRTMFSYAQYLRNSCTPESVENTVSKNKIAGLRTVRLSLYKPKVSEKDGGKEVEKEKPIPVVVGLVNSSLKRKRKGPKESKPEQKEPKVPKKVKTKDKSSYMREFKARVKGPKKPYYDEEDRAALRRMSKLRVDWSPAEDSLLLLCKVSSAYLFPHKKGQIITFCVVRDLLHSRFPESRNKTSKACQRRINYILKNPATEENVAIILEEIKQDEEIANKFKPAKLSYTLPMLSKLYVNTFKELVNRLVVKYASNESKDTPDLPDNYSEFQKRFKVIRTSNSLKKGPKLNELTSVDDIDHYVVNALIFSSLCTKQDRESWAYQLYLAYQKYPQKLLNTVLTSIREAKMISYKKYYNRSKYIRTCLPLSTSPFQLSLTFIYMFHMKYTYDIFGSCWNMVKMIREFQSSDSC